jgi:hypothetical protein
MNYNTENNKILLSTAQSSNKATTNGYEITECTPKQLMQIMNRKAVAIGLYINGHRNAKYLKAVGNVYFVDIDTPQDGKPYYQTIEAKLKALDITFVSVPSKSANEYPYKRHIAIMLDSYLPTSKKAFKEVAHYILETVDIDVSKIDNRVAFNNISFLAPACINKHFTNYDDTSKYHQGKPLSIPTKDIYDDVKPNDYDINSTELIKFADGSTVPIFEAKKLIPIGEKKPCYCPKHDDHNPSAVFFHNSNGAILHCSSCGTININNDFIPKQPSILHKDYNYSIIVNNAPKAKISTLISKIGNYSYLTDKSIIWAYDVSSIDDIYNLLLAKVYLVEKGFEISYKPAPQKHTKLLSTTTLNPIISNMKLPTTYIPQGIQKTEHYCRYKQTATYIFNHYLFVETAIYTTYQNLIKPHIAFNDTCNLGIAYFEHILQVMDKQKDFMQSNKTYPMKLKNKAKIKITQKRINSMQHGKQVKITARQKKVMQLLNGEKYLKPNGKPNLTAIAKKLKIQRKTLYCDIKALEEKALINTS